MLDGETCGNWNGIESYDCPITGPLYLRARHYAPHLGRFLSRDVWDGDYRNPLTLNRWNYVEANPVNYVDPSGKLPCFSTNVFECLSLFGLVPDYYGIFIVETFRNEFENQASYITSAGLHPTTIAAAIAVQSQWINSPGNQLQRLYDWLKKHECMPYIPFLEDALGSSGLGYAQTSDEFGDPYIMANSIKAMTERIKPVDAMCIKCNAKDRLIAAAMAQNGGFSTNDMRNARNNYLKKDVDFGIEIDWVRYFSELSPLDDDSLDIYNNSRALWRTNFDTRFQLQLFTQDLMVLHGVFNWELPPEISWSDLISMITLAIFNKE